MFSSKFEGLYAVLQAISKSTSTDLMTLKKLIMPKAVRSVPSLLPEISLSYGQK